MLTSNLFETENWIYPRLNALIETNKPQASVKEIFFQEGIEDNFYTHLLDWNGTKAALGTKDGLNIFNPLFFSAFPNEFNKDSSQKLKFDRIQNLLALKFADEKSIFYSNKNSSLIQLDCNRFIKFR